MIESYEDILKNADCLHSPEDISAALDHLAEGITHELKNTFPLILCVMTGALIPLGHLLTRLIFPLEVDYIHATRYQGQIVGGELNWIVKPRTDLKDRTILVVDDIMDGGLTLGAIIDYCKMSKAKKVYTAVMVNKIRTREAGVDFEPDFTGLTTPNRYLFGFGLDYEEKWRNLPAIYALKE